MLYRIIFAVSLLICFSSHASESPQATHEALRNSVQLSTCGCKNLMESYECLLDGNEQNGRRLISNLYLIGRFQTVRCYMFDSTQWPHYTVTPKGHIYFYAMQDIAKEKRVRNLLLEAQSEILPPRQVRSWNEK